MGKTAHNDVLDAMLDYIADNGDILTACSTEPTTYAEATATYKLADTTLTKGDGNGDYTIAEGDASGRKLTVAEQANFDVDTSGTAQHVAICDSVNSKLLYVTTCTGQALTSGNKVTVPAFDIEIADPA
ncbi:MAG: hypothetical protein JRG97_13315 [Deltaproteobacteria bacterium]|nr:hypothetical protein [Deltaproteobacteria bacterium]MBW2052924.1 hypothetical protein [Deltaproteobacteria bacterium]MBW2142025.1 hypothetical protein [Deltaproteobacteria bacterium]MBW2324436.1 hypothetical protein [Deltaproteobacteria bacterium]